MSSNAHIPLEELELLAVGALPPEEAAAAQRHASACKECARNLAEARRNAALLAFAAPQTRPAGTVKAELVARIRASRETEEYYAWPLKAEAPAGAEEKPKRAWNWWNWVLVPAAVALAVVSVALSWQNRRITEELETHRKAAESLIRDRQQIEKLVGVLAAPDTITVKLAGVGNGAGANGIANGMVKFNAKAGMVLYQADLPALPPDKSYQMWLMPMNGAPINAGLLGPGGNEWGNMWTSEVPTDIQAKAFAVTIEPVGGMPQPTGPKVLLGTT